jgi:hydroxymethylbilane synthase
MIEVRIATRASRLAMAQAGLVARLLTEADPRIMATLVEVATTGDIDRTSPVATLTEVGAFVRAVQQRVLEGAADVAVHSCKDLPVSGPDGLETYYPARGMPWDVLCGMELGNLPPGATVGTGSPRRSAQLQILRPDVEVIDIRGNVDTRLSKVEAGEVDAVVLAEAGLQRSGLIDQVSTRFSVDQMVPAPAQGALAVEVVAGSEFAHLVAEIDHAPTRSAVEAERLLLEVTGAGCRAALGALAQPSADGMRLWGFVADEGGPRRSEVTARGPGDAVASLVARLEL